MKTDCPFCTTARTEGRILKEGEYSYVLLSNPRLMPGHLLVIPKRHIEGRLGELSVEEQAEIFGLLSKFQKMILEKLAKGCDIRQNYKPYIGDNPTHVNHMHFHLLPRNFEDELHHAELGRKNLYQPLSEAEVDKVVNLLS